MKQLIILILIFAISSTGCKKENKLEYGEWQITAYSKNIPYAVAWQKSNDFAKITWDTSYTNYYTQIILMTGEPSLGVRLGMVNHSVGDSLFVRVEDNDESIQSSQAWQDSTKDHYMGVLAEFR